MERTLGGWRKVRRALRERLLHLGARREAASERRRLFSEEELQAAPSTWEAGLESDDMETEEPRPRENASRNLVLLLARKMEFAESSGGGLGSAPLTERWRSYPILDYGQIRADGIENEYKDAVLSLHEEPNFWPGIVLQSSRALGGPTGRLLQLSRAGLRLDGRCRPLPAASHAALAIASPLWLPASPTWAGQRNFTVKPPYASMAARSRAVASCSSCWFTSPTTRAEP